MTIGNVRDMIPNSYKAKFSSEEEALLAFVKEHSDLFDNNFLKEVALLDSSKNNTSAKTDRIVFENSSQNNNLEDWIKRHKLTDGETIMWLRTFLICSSEGKESGFTLVGRLPWTPELVAYNRKLFADGVYSRLNSSGEIDWKYSFERIAKDMKYQPASLRIEMVSKFNTINDDDYKALFEYLPYMIDEYSSLDCYMMQHRLQYEEIVLWVRTFLSCFKEGKRSGLKINKEGGWSNELRTFVLGQLKSKKYIRLTSSEDIDWKYSFNKLIEELDISLEEFDSKMPDVMERKMFSWDEYKVRFYQAAFMD